MKHNKKVHAFRGAAALATAVLALAASVIFTACPQTTGGGSGGGGNIPVPAVEKYAVVFNADGGNGGALTAKVDGNEIHSGDKVEKGKLVEFTAQPANGKRADTWFIEGGDFEAGSGTAGSDTARVRVSGNISVRVSFKDAEAGKHIVRFGIEGSAGESRLTAAVAGGSAILSGNEVSDGSIVEFRAAPESGKTVDMWTVEGGSFEAGSGTAGSDTARVRVSGNISVRVSFKNADPNKRIVTFGIEGNAGENGITAAVSGGTAILSGNEVSDGAVVEFTAVPAPGYKVKSWTIVQTDDQSPLAFEEGGTEGALSAKAKAVSNLTVKVAFERIIYTVAFGFEGSSEQGSFTAQKDGVDFASGGNAFYGEELTFSAEAKAGWKITLWTIVKTDDNSPLTFAEGGTEGSLTAKANVTCNLTVKVKFEKIICTVAFTVSSGHGALKAKAEGAPVVSVSPIQVEYGKTVEFTAAPDVGYKVKAWTVNGNTVTADSTYSLLVVRDVNLTVTFTEDNVRITISGDERVNEGGYIDIPKGKTWKEIKTQIEPKFALKEEWQGGDYGLYRWALNDENGNTIGDTHVFTEDTVVYAVTNYLKFSGERTEIYGYTGAKPRGRIIIDDTVTKIAGKAFRGCKDLTGELKLPASLIALYGDNNAGPFEGCTGLQGVNFSACTNLTEIGDHVFRGCTGLKGELKLPVSLTKIGDSAFEGCTGFTGELKLPASLTEIGYDAFEGCTGFTGDLKLPVSLTKIDVSAFEGCTGFTGELKFPASLTEIRHSAFKGCTGLQGINFSACTGLTKICGRIFENCTGLKGELKLPSCLIEIEHSAFAGCTGLTGELKLPVSLTKIGNDAFEDCTSLNKADFSLCTNLTYISGFKGCTGLKGELKLPASLTEIGSGAFEGCTGLTGELKLPASLTEIGYEAFKDCTGLQGVNFSACTALKKIEVVAFSRCTGLTGELKFPASLTEIGYEAFAGCTSLHGINFSACINLAKIGYRAFGGCTSLRGINFSACVNLTKIEQSTFEGCTGLTGTIVFPASLKEIDSSESHGAFRNCTDLTGADFSACTALTELKEYSFYGCSKLASIILPPNLTTIKKAVFAGCTNLANVTLPSSLTTIGGSAFSGCKSLTSITFSSSLTTIGNYAFADCNRLTTIVFSVHFPAIGDEAFSKHFLETLDLSACTDCTESDIQFFKKYSIETIKLPSNFTSISERPFAGFSRLLSLDFSACTGITEIAFRAFISCHNIKNIVLPPNITTIGKEAFTYCKNLKSVDLSGCISLTKIDYRAFAECIEAEVVLPESITSITPGAFGGARIYEKNDLDCKKVKIKGGTQFNRIKALVIASYYSADRIEQY